MSNITRRKALMSCCNYWQSPFRVGSHHIARSLVELGWEVAFISDPISPFHVINGITPELKQRYLIYRQNGISDLDNRLWAYIPGAFLSPNNKPILRSQWVHKYWYATTYPNIINIAQKNGFDEVDLLYFDNPTHMFWLNKIQSKRSIFRVADNNTDFVKNTKALEKLEIELIKTVDLVVYSAENLKEYVNNKGPKRMLHVPNGVYFNHFTNTINQLPEEYKKIPKPIALYVGAMDFWFDFDLLNMAAEYLPNVSFVLIGPEKKARLKLKKLANIHILGRRDYSQLPNYIKNADLGLIPFNVQEYPNLVNSINPLKLYEYMACGLPVISMEWDELIHLKSPAKLCKTGEEFIAAIQNELTQKNDSQTFIQYSHNQDWSKRVELILSNLQLV